MACLNVSAIHFVVTHRPNGMPFGKTVDLYPSAICEISASDGMRSYRVLMHECGHAIHFRAIKSKYKSIRTNMDRWFIEGIAKFFETIVDNGDWLTRSIKINSKDANLISGLRSLQKILAFRESLVVAIVESIMPEILKDQRHLPIWPVLAKQLLFPDTEITEYSANTNLGSTNDTQRMVFQEGHALDLILSDLVAAAIKVSTSDTGTVSPDAARVRYSSETARTIAPLIEAGPGSWQNTITEKLGDVWNSGPLTQELEKAIGAIP